MKMIVKAFMPLSIILMSFAPAETSQIIKTQLHVTIRNELGNLEEGASVKLYEKESDFKSETNVVQEGVTDKKGIVRFKDLKTVAYYVLVTKGDKNNFGGGEQTGKLEASKINKVTIIIE